MLTPRPTDPNAAAHERLYRTLRQQVMHGELDPGQSLTLRGLGKQFGVSMTPAREAVRRLVAEGALTLSSSGRISTPELTPERIEELAAINLMNGEAAVRGDAVTYVRTNLEFHRTLYLRAQTPAMLAMCETVWLQLGPTMRAVYAKVKRREPPTHHRMILAALKAGDEPGLRLAVRTDVTQGPGVLSFQEVGRGR
jgi:DNA-binding GntR family transcriptional regulator